MIWRRIWQFLSYINSILKWQRSRLSSKSYWKRWHLFQTLILFFANVLLKVLWFVLNLFIYWSINSIVLMIMWFVDQLEEDPLNTILNLHQLLETCRFQEFWVNITSIIQSINQSFNQSVIHLLTIILSPFLITSQLVIYIFCDVFAFGLNYRLIYDSNVTYFIVIYESFQF